MSTQPSYVLFVGGPADGRHMVMHHCPRRYEVAVMPEIEPMRLGVSDQVMLVPRTFEYAPLRMGGHQFYIPEDWMRSPIDPYERLMTALTRGYVGRP